MMRFFGGLVVKTHQQPATATPAIAAPAAAAAAINGIPVKGGAGDGASAIWTLMTAIANDGTLVTGTLIKQARQQTNTGGIVVGTPNGKIYVPQNSAVTLTTGSNGAAFYNTTPYYAFTDTTGSYWLAIPSLNKPWSALGIGGQNIPWQAMSSGVNHPSTTKIYAGSTNDVIYTGDSGNTSLTGGANTIDCDILNIKTSTIYRMSPYSPYGRQFMLMPFQVFGRATGTTAISGSVAVNLATTGTYYKPFGYNGNTYTVTAIPSTLIAGNATGISTITCSVLCVTQSSFTIYWNNNTLTLPFNIDWTASGY